MYMTSLSSQNSSLQRVDNKLSRAFYAIGKIGYEGTLISIAGRINQGRSDQKAFE